jgi:tetratricopeptide (TPR) repeat protein
MSNQSNKELSLMRTILAASIITISIATASAQHSGHQMPPQGAEPRPELVSGLGSHHHLVSTANPEAQKFFDQGLRFVFAFNHDEAIRSFKRAAELDPGLAMAHWGIGLALGPNINLDVDPKREKAAYEATQKALSLSAKAPENERAYIQALAKRYSIDPKADLKKLALDYKNAMGELVKEYPDDLDAATLFAEAAMDLRPWQLWTADGKPAEGTEEIVSVLESVLRRNPNHAGAIHYYIHAVEASPNPERALAFAPKLPQLMPAAGHIVHMPAHIYHRTGDYVAAAKSNRDAALADEAYLKASGTQGVYPFMYYAHNVHFQAVAHSLAGQYAEASAAAKKLDDYVTPHLKQMPMLEGYLTVTPLIRVQFQKWEEIDKLPKPDANLPALTAIWHFSRGLAFEARGRLEDAEREYAAFLAAEKVVPANSYFGLMNSAASVLEVARHALQARIGAHKSNDAGMQLMLWRKAVELEDALAYDEPPPWFLSVRIWLGGALMKRGDFATAEQVFREDLQRNKRNGRALFGLAEALKAQKKSYAATLVNREFNDAWKDADTKLSIDSF